MSTSPSEYLKRVYPRRFLFRGAALQSLIWTLLGTVALSATLVSVLLLLSLLQLQGRVSLDGASADEFYALFGTQSEAGGQESIRGTDAPPADAGLRAVAWNLRGRPVVGLVVWICGLSSHFDETGLSFLILLMLMSASAFLTVALFGHARRLAEMAAAHTTGQLRESLHRHALRTGTSDLFESEIASVLTLFTDEVETVRRWIAQFTCQVSQAPLQLLAVLLLGVMLDWRLLVECGIPLLACWAFILRQRAQNSEKTDLELDRASTELKLTTEGIHCSRLVRGFLLDNFEHVRFERHLNRYETHLSEVEKLNRRQTLQSLVVGLAGLAIVLYIAGGRVLNETAYQLLLAEATFLCGLLAFAAVPLSKLIGLLSLRDAARTSVDRVYRYLNTIPDVGQAVGAEFLQPLDKAIEYNNVSYAVGRRKLLNELTLKIPANGTTAIVAFDPAESMALTAMLPRFIDPSSGHVTIDGHDVEGATLESLRSEVIWAGGHHSWFTGSVVENIGGGDERFSLAQITDAAKRAHAHNFIQKLPQGYETVVGRHGEQLTESQGFRLALARAILRDPALLIIEEPDSTTDADEKAMLEDACRTVAKGRTVIFLPQRLRTLKGADRIVLLNRGHVEVVGTHEALLQSSSLYRHWEYLRFNEFRRDISCGEQDS
ncbi:MAG: ABC transporter transmembrane domain-containing protein [Planctomycetota bacterium]|jgi:ABC-type multidrug transport system fused ATPase/permease subunit